MCHNRAPVGADDRGGTDRALPWGMNGDQWIGWAAAVVLLLTIGNQTWKQYTARTARGVSLWLFIGQIAASSGFLLYAARIGDPVFVVTNILLIVSAAIGLGLVVRNRRLDAEADGESAESDPQPSALSEAGH